MLLMRANINAILWRKASITVTLYVKRTSISVVLMRSTSISTVLWQSARINALPWRRVSLKGVLWKRVSINAVVWMRANVHYSEGEPSEWYFGGMPASVQYYEVESRSEWVQYSGREPAYCAILWMRRGSVKHSWWKPAWVHSLVGILEPVQYPG